jgi:hypothetical protein
MKFKQVNIVNKHHEIWTYSDQDLRIILKNSRMAGKLNSLLGNQYPVDTRFKSSDEPQFKIKPNQMDQVVALLKLKSNLLEKK